MRPRSAPVGLIPAAGRATRVQPLPCSKEIYPVGFHQVRFGEENRPVPKVASHYLLERMRIAGVGEAFIVLGDGKWDIPAYLGDGEATGVRLAYLTIKDSPGTPYTVDRAFAFIEERAVAFGFADLIFEPPDAFAALLAHQVESDAAAVLGLFPAHDPSLVDMVEVDDHGRVVKIDIKPA